MNTAIRELREAESIMEREWEGNLSQQGGDCPVCILQRSSTIFVVNVT
jgi:hypothetical protein